MHRFSSHYIFVLILSASFLPAFATQDNFTDPNISLNLNYPGVLASSEKFVLSSVVKPTVDQVSNITVTITCPELQIAQDSFHVDKLAKDSAFGNDFDATVKSGVPDGAIVANVQVDYFVKGLFDSQPVKHSIAQTTQFIVASKPSLSLDVQAPSDVFSGEPFSVRGTVSNHGSGAHNLQLSVYSSQLQISGKKSLEITSLDSGQSSDFEFVVQTQKNMDPVSAVVHVNGTYSDDGGKNYTIDNTFNVYARQRGMLEIGDANGIWVGQFFIAPVVGVGTIVSSVIGFLIFVWHYRNKKKKKRAKRS